MQTWNRWRDEAPPLSGALLLFTPFVLSLATMGSDNLAAWILAAVGGVAAVSLALLWVGFPKNRVIAGMTVLLGMLLLLVPWALGESWFTSSAWVSFIMGVLLIITAGRIAVQNQHNQVRLPHYRALSGDRIVSERPDSYRRASNLK